MKELLTRLRAEGIHLTLSSEGKLEVTGEKKTVAKYLPLLREHKAELMAMLAGQLPEWCVPGCKNYEEINLPRKGLTAGCIRHESDIEEWRRLDRMTACPTWN